MDYQASDPTMMYDMAEAMESRFFGKYRGLVDNNADKSGRGRLKVKVPAVMGDQAVWALPCVPYAGDNAGSYLIPEKDTLVWVEFEAGDPSYPIWTGCFWPDGKPPRNNKNIPPTPQVKTIRTKQGLIVSLDDAGQTIDVSDKNGANVLTIEVLKGKIKIKGAIKAVVEAPQIELVENATHPVVFGDQLLSYLGQVVAAYQAHTHFITPVTPVPTGPPLTPLPPPTPIMISKRVRSG